MAKYSGNIFQTLPIYVPLIYAGRHFVLRQYNGKPELNIVWASDDLMRFELRDNFPINSEATFYEIDNNNRISIFERETKQLLYCIETAHNIRITIALGAKMLDIELVNNEIKINKSCYFANQSDIARLLIRPDGSYSQNAIIHPLVRERFNLVKDR